MRVFIFFLVSFFFFQFSQTVFAQNTTNFSFDKALILIPNGNSTKQINVVINFSDTELQIKSKKNGTILKSFKYSEIKAAEYSYTEHRMWKEGIGLGAASVIFPPAILVALPLSFAKNKHHWFSFRSESDFAVLRISKSIRKIMVLTFETKTGIKVEGKGNEK